MLVNHQNKWELTNDKDICSHRNKDKLWCVCVVVFSPAIGVYTTLKLNTWAIFVHGIQINTPFNEILI